MIPVKSGAKVICRRSARHRWARTGAARGWGWSVETTVDQALIRGSGTALHAYVSGLSSV